MSARRSSGLGRGLDALLGEGERQAEGAAVVSLPVDSLRPNPEQPRNEIDPETLAELSDSIRAQGVIQPIVVAGDPESGYSIVAGERRWRAARRAGLAEVPVVVRAVASERERLELALVENLQRSDLNAVEEAEAYDALRERFGLTQAEIAERVGKARSTVTNALRLLRLPPQVLELLRSGRLTAGQARPLLAVDSRAQQVRLAERAAAEGLSARAVEASAGSGSEPGGGGKRRSRSAQHRDVHTEAAQERLTRSLQTRVEIRRRGAGGTIRLHFHSEDELMRLFDRLVRGGA